MHLYTDYDESEIELSFPPTAHLSILGSDLVVIFDDNNQLHMSITEANLLVSRIQQVVGVSKTVNPTNFSGEVPR